MPNDPLAVIAIQQVIARYARGVDRGDRALLLSCYWPDGQDDHGVFRGSPAGLVDWVIPMVGHEFTSTTHNLFQSLIEVEGDRAWAETYWAARSSPRSGGKVRLSSGRYEDLFERRDGEWRILARELVFDWETLFEEERWRRWPSPAEEAARSGCMGENDLSYRFRAAHHIHK